MEQSAPDRQLEVRELSAVSAALNRVQAVIEFDLQGTILHANENFLAALGYSIEEVRGKHHQIFVILIMPALRRIASSGNALGAASSTAANTGA